MTFCGRMLIGTLVAVAATAAPVTAQPPHHDWRTIETRSFRVHYPVEYEVWTLHAVRRLESIRARVVQEVGYEPTARVDVLVMDPVAEPNGFVIPLLGSPRMVLWTSPPAADSVVGAFRSWPELLITHEDVHVVHLLRPSRNPFSRALEGTVLPLGPIARRAPRWAVEGYATFLEGQLTGSGRPHGDLRAAILRRWAQQGRLPSYARLASDGERWHGMSMAYLAGSAYLEWLVARRAPDALRDVWARLTARTDRTFDEAFSGVFGEDPERLYGRFTAELTERAMLAERTRAPHVREGELWQRITWSTGVPHVSPAGDRLAVVLRHRDRPARLVIWSTEPDVEREREWQTKVERRLARDPQDVAPVRDQPLPRAPLHQLPAIDGAAPESPRWMPDGASVLFTRVEADAHGVLRPDLFRWHPEPGRVDRMTSLADVRLADPAPDGRWAVAVRHRHGASQLVRVDMASGAVEALTDPSVEIVYDGPRISPDGRALAYLRHKGGQWRAVIRDLHTGRERELHTPPDATLAHPAWSHDGAQVFLAIGEQGFFDIHAVSATGDAAPAAITRTHGAALGPAPARDGTLFFLSLEPHGLDLRRITEGTAPPLPAAIMRAPLAPAVPPPAPDPPRPAEAAVQPGRPFGFGRHELMPLLGGVHAPSRRVVELGLRGGDVLGRFNWLAIGAISRGAGVMEGLGVSAAWRGWPVSPRAHAFSVAHRPSGPPIDMPDATRALDARLRGVELGLDWQRRYGRRRLMRASAGGLLAWLVPLGVQHQVESLAQRLLGGELAYTALPSRGSWHWRYAGELRVESGLTGRNRWQRVGAEAQAGLGYHRSDIRFTMEHRRVEGHPSPFDRIQMGGVAGSVDAPLAAAARVHVPALPRATLIGDRYDRQRVDARLARVPVFFERHRVADRGAPSGAWLRLVGTEAAVAPGPIPLVRLPAPVLRVGAARILDPPFERDLRWWLSLSWRP